MFNISTFLANVNILTAINDTPSLERDSSVTFFLMKRFESSAVVSNLAQVCSLYVVQFHSMV